MRNGIKISKHFSLHEFEDIHAGGLVLIQPVLIERLEKLRDLLREPVLITSGFRTHETNKNVGGVSNSKHMLGAAADIVVFKRSPAYVATVAADLFPFVRAYKEHVHVDVRGLY